MKYYKNLSIDESDFSVQRQGCRIHLTTTEYQLFITLLDHSGHICSRNFLLASAWNITVPIQTRTVDVHGYTRRKRDPYKPIDYLGVFSIGEFVGYLIRSLVAPAFVWFPDILIGMPDNLIQAIAAVWLVVMSIFVPTVIERAIDGF